MAGSAAPLIPERLGPEWAGAAARVHRRSLVARMPWLPNLHSPEEDIWFYQTHVFPSCEVWGVLIESDLAGFIAFHSGHIDHLYVHPDHQGHGIGAELLHTAKSRNTELRLWTFQANGGARMFYERHGFMAIEFTDGSGNEEKEPDVLYRWTKGG